MICVAIQEKDVNTCLALLENIELGEIRIDLCKFDTYQVKEVFSKSKARLIATCRPDGLTAEQQKQLLITAIENGASMVDIEIEADEKYKQEIINIAKLNKCKVIISYHNFASTPNKTELKQIVANCFTSGADIAKIAVQANSKKDSARLLSLYETDKRILVLGMGEHGKITRVAATLLGAPFTFASIDADSATAPGQMDVESLNKIYSLLL